MEMKKWGRMKKKGWRIEKKTERTKRGRVEEGKVLRNGEKKK